MIDPRFSEAELDQHQHHITTFIRDQIDTAGADGAVLGLSGGIDSTLTAYLAADALGAENVHGLVLPAVVSGDENMSDAERVALDLGLPHDLIEIEPIVDSLLSAYPEAEGDREAVGNARARVRAVLNYLVANHENRLVLGTGNRSEAAVGYFTKYGDGAVDCHPIGNLYKAQVRQLARHVGVPEDLAAKPATAELWADQTDEDEMGLSYETLDSILVTHVDGPLSVAATCRELDVEPETVERVREMYQHSEHKRQVPPSPEPLS
ncbi:NAD synthase, ammonia-dependent [Natrialba magadii ATCC 43099]|uniref:NH(3)-dependent NAD(+) synthetase n=1 Tax=Natrialba magadii (strain ATCC 43099 / DSM 3394 / CCM 3739 / CIP 104546 / IAM 13178 / JCM 8861 / NBRC 102185 / NCIMB 2190 / MS3) TaxID=547559 RepID=D3SZY9_NATMM|nr:NAD+ synthase [Natrialba magadii]ADD06399.1 NAD synthase, ammonia-dependent [Natrialba magadii ATCC 43099]ELY31574.1 NAD synthetase [Natrialba magadii ATCC 43099]